MKKYLLFWILLFSAHGGFATPLELPECKHAKYIECSVDTPCDITVYPRGGICIKLSNIKKGEKYLCRKNGFTEIDSVDYKSENVAGLGIQKPNFFTLNLDATKIHDETVSTTFTVYDFYKVAEHFLFACVKDNNI